MSICSGASMGLESVTFTKDYTVGFKRADYDIPKQSWNFFGSQPGHSKSNMHSLQELTERRTFAGYYNFYLRLTDTIYGVPRNKAEPKPCLLKCLVILNCYSIPIPQGCGHVFFTRMQSGEGGG
jgi:hypothetical protein